jgi:hypothetical protein
VAKVTALNFPDILGMPIEGIMVFHRFALLVLVVVANPFWAAAQTARDEKPPPLYYPDVTWQHTTPSESGINPQLLKGAIDFAIAGETKAPRDLVLNHYQTFGREPFGYAIGPIRTSVGPLLGVKRLCPKIGPMPALDPCRTNAFIRKRCSR